MKLNLSPRISTEKLIITNTISAAALLWLFFYGDYHQRLIRKLRVSKSVVQTQAPASYSYHENDSYWEQTEFHSLFETPKKIVMLGNSITFRMNWFELLNRPDVANRGIGSDVTAGFVNRVGTILKLKPRICFIEGGVNDLGVRVPKDSIVYNLRLLIDTFHKNGIKPVLTAITYVRPPFTNADSFNLKITELNRELKQLAAQHRIPLIDLNQRLSEGNRLRAEFAQKDGVHFTAAAYLVWKEEIEKILKHEGL